MIRKYYFINKFETNNIEKQDKQTVIIYRNYSSKIADENLILKIKKEHLRMMTLIHLQITFWLLKNLNPKYFFLKMYMVLFLNLMKQPLGTLKNNLKNLDIQLLIKL